MHIEYPHDLSAPGAVDALLAFHRARFGGARMQDGGGVDEQPADGPDRDRDQDAPKPADDRSDRRDDDLGESGKRALEAERRAKRAAEKAVREAEARASELEAKIAEAERAKMTDQERIAAERDDWRKKFEEQAAVLAARELDVLRRDVAAEKGLPAGMARRLNGTTREELESDADELATLVARDDAAVPRAPKPDPSQGVTSTGSRASTVSAAMERYLAGRGTTPTM